MILDIVYIVIQKQISLEPLHVNWIFIYECTLKHSITCNKYQMSVRSVKPNLLVIVVVLLVYTILTITTVEDEVEITVTGWSIQSLGINIFFVQWEVVFKTIAKTNIASEVLKNILAQRGGEFQDVKAGLILADLIRHSIQHRKMLSGFYYLQASSWYSFFVSIFSKKPQSGGIAQWVLVPNHIILSGDSKLK